MVALMGFTAVFTAKIPTKQHGYSQAFIQRKKYRILVVWNNRQRLWGWKKGNAKEKYCMLWFVSIQPSLQSPQPVWLEEAVKTWIISTNKIIFTHWQSILISYRFWAFILFSWLLLSMSETSTVTSCESVFCDESGGAALRRSELFRVNCIASGISSGSVVYSSCTWRSVRDRTAWKKKKIRMQEN